MIEFLIVLGIVVAVLVVLGVAMFGFVKALSWLDGEDGI